MAVERRPWAQGTWVDMNSRCVPWTFLQAYALCPDGKRRLVRLAETASSFDRVLGRITVLGRTVSGYITWHDEKGLTTARNQAVHFVPTGKYQYIFLTTQLNLPPDTEKGVVLDLAKERGLINDRR